jgi:hypothetical protein
LGVLCDDLDHRAIFNFSIIHAGEFPVDFFDHLKTTSRPEAEPPVSGLTVSALVSAIKEFPSGGFDWIQTIPTACSAPKKRFAFGERVSIVFFRTGALLRPELKPSVASHASV